MFRKLSTILVCILMVASINAQNKFNKKYDPRAPHIIEPIHSSNSVSLNSIGTTLNTESIATPILAAKMWNVYGTVGSSTNAIDYDPISNTLAIVHRGDRANNTGSGYIWYVVSNDLGANWVDIGNFNWGGYTFGRYPNMLISNATQTTDPFSADLKPIMFWCGHGTTGNSWEAANTATDAQFYAGSPLYQNVVCDSICYLNQGSVDQNNGRVAFLVEDYDAAFATLSISLHSSSDQGATWEVTEVLSTNELYRDGTPGNGFVNSPFMDIAPDGMNMLVGWQGADGLSPSTSSGAKRSTDGGATWFDVEYLVPQDTSLGIAQVFPDTSSNETMWWDSDVTHSAHGPVIISPINDNGGAGGAYLFEIHWNYETGGGWEASVITERNMPGEWAVGAGADRVRAESELARTDDGEYLFVKYQDHTEADTVDRIPDIYITGKDIDSSWIEPINVTNTPDIWEKYSNLASRVNIVGETDDSLTAQLHIFYSIMAPDATTGQPDWDDTGEAEIWYLQDVTITVPKAIVDGIDNNGNGGIPAEFALEQNYPNPFNPSTTISFTLQKSANVKLNVYSINGEKVATLANGSRTAGTHDIVFDASNLSSGVYFYTLSSGEFSQTKKMVLMK